MTATDHALVPEIVPRHDIHDIAGGTRRLTREEARILTDEIRSSANRLWVLVSVAHDRGAWRALGYETWKEYVTVELGLSESRSYQLIDTGRVMRAIAEATNSPAEDLQPVPARMVAKVKDHLPKLQRAIAGYLADNPGENPSEVIEAALLEVIPRQPREPLAHDEDGPGGGEICPACMGGGDLGTGPAAKKLSEFLQKSMNGYFARGNPKPRHRRS